MRPEKYVGDRKLYSGYRTGFCDWFEGSGHSDALVGKQEEKNGGHVRCTCGRETLQLLDEPNHNFLTRCV
jgi:hypothetical protein